MSLETIRKNHLKDLESFLNKFTEGENSLCGQMIRYHFQTGGKRIRGLIPLLVYEAFEKSPLEAIPLGAAIEMIHNATLVHDDLQDGDQLRRGVPTVWRKFSQPQAINCGDVMFQLVYELFLKVSHQKLVELIEQTTQSIKKIIEGQAQEFVIREEVYPKLSRYFEVTRGKTAELFRLAVVLPLSFTSASPELQKICAAFAEEFGIFFQIQDDFLDLYGKKGRHKTASDIAEGKTSFFVAYLNENGSEEDKSKVAQILKKPRDLTSSENVAEVLSIFEKYQCKRAAIDWTDKLYSKIKQDAVLQTSPRMQALFLDLFEAFGCKLRPNEFPG